MQILHDTMKHLVVLHEDLIQLSNKKTEEIKQGDMEQLSKTLMDERKQIQAITQTEEKRQALVEDLFMKVNPDVEEKTVTTLLAHIDNDEYKQQLEDVVALLIDAIVQLRQVEQLNQELMAQSMQFVQLSLDMLQPSIQRMNYDEKQTIQDSVKQSVFDSKA